MPNYILSRPNEVNSTFPTILGGEVDLYEITSQDPIVGDYVTVNPTTGEVIFTGFTSPVISEINIKGSNVAGEWADSVYVITPFEIPQGTITAGTSNNVFIPYVDSPITIEFTDGGNVPDLSGGYFAVIPTNQTDFTAGTSLTGNVITGDYYLSNTVASYTFETTGISINYPITNVITNRKYIREFIQ